MPINQYSMDHKEATCTRAFHAVTKTTDPQELITGFYVKRLFRYNFLDILSQYYEEAYEGDDGNVYEAQWSHWAEEITTLKASSEEDAKSQFDEFVFLHDRDDELCFPLDELDMIEDVPDIGGSYDHLNGELSLWSEALGDRTIHGVLRLKDVKALYSAFVEETKAFKELGIELHDYQERKKVVDKNWERLLTNKHWWADNRRPLIGTLVIIASILFGWGFSEIFAPPPDDIGDGVFWMLIPTVLFNVVGFTIILKRDNGK